MIQQFNFGGTPSAVHITDTFPSQNEILHVLQATLASDGNTSGAESTRGKPLSSCVIICDENTRYIADAVAGTGNETPICVLRPGEAAKHWGSVEAALKTAQAAGLGRDGVFIGVGGGVVTDITGFAASIYMRGARLAFVSTTLLGMVDAAVGGKTGIDLFERKNLAGSFYPASFVALPVAALRTLPKSEIKSGLAEIIKTAILDSQNNDESAFTKFHMLKNQTWDEAAPILRELVAYSVSVKGRIAEADPKETGTERALLNLGHTFGHALESSAGLGAVSHGEAVAWGIAKASELGVALNITPEKRAADIIRLLDALGYETASPHPALRSSPARDAFFRSLHDDKKKKAGTLRFVVPAARGAALTQIDGEKTELVKKIACGT